MKEMTGDLLLAPVFRMNQTLAFLDQSSKAIYFAFQFQFVVALFTTLITAEKHLLEYLSFGLAIELFCLSNCNNTGINND